MNFQDIERAKAMLCEATVILANAASDPVQKPRVVSKMARNIQHGEVVDIPEIGTGEVVGWGMFGDQVTILLPGNRLASFEAVQRVRVVRG